jgi:hypothetical protein
MDATKIKEAKKQVNNARKQGKATVGWTDSTIGASISVVGTLREASSQQAPSDDPTVHIIDASDELQRRSSEDSSTGWSDGLSGDTVGLSDAWFESRQRRTKTDSLAPDEPTSWVRGSVSLSDGLEETNRDVLTRSPSAPDDPMPSVYSVRVVLSENLNG